jgi:hypothetical protein
MSGMSVGQIEKFGPGSESIKKICILNLVEEKKSVRFNLQVPDQICSNNYIKKGSTICTWFVETLTKLCFYSTPIKFLNFGTSN